MDEIIYVDSLKSLIYNSKIYSIEKAKFSKDTCELCYVSGYCEVNEPSICSRVFRIGGPNVREIGIYSLTIGKFNASIYAYEYLKHQMRVNISSHNFNQ